MAKHIAFYGGTFDPVHIGHINVAIRLFEKNQIDEVWFVPTKKNPLKEQEPSASADHRLAMLHLALEPFSFCSVYEKEIKSSKTSYTVDTVQAILHDRLSYVKKISLVLGDDLLSQFDRWHEVDKLLSQVEVIVVTREGKNIVNLLKKNNLYNKGMFSILPIPLLDISSTEIKKRIQEGLYCGHLLPAKVLDYIQAYQLYYFR